MFETFAVVSTLGCIAIFFALVHANRSSGQDGEDSSR